MLLDLSKDLVSNYFFWGKMKLNGSARTVLLPFSFFSEGTPYAGGYFKVKFRFTNEFPAVPPKCMCFPDCFSIGTKVGDLSL